MTPWQGTDDGFFEPVTLQQSARLALVEARR
jgi:hypothetical protein